MYIRITYVDTYSDVIERIDKEPPFDLHAYLAPSSSSTSTALNIETSNVVSTAISSTAATTAAITTTTTTTTTSTVTPTSSTVVDKPRKEPSKPKLYVLN